MPVNFKEHKNELLFVPLGGSSEIGMNLNLYHYKGKWLMIDLGVGFADEWLPGVDLIVPDIDFIIERKKDLVGLVLTHAHEDHIGAVPYLWSELDCPIYATPFTSEVVKAKFDGMNLGVKPKLKPIAPEKQVDLGPFSIELVPITHSIPEMHGIALRTEKGTVFHTGDWKLDPEPLVGPVTDEKRLQKIGDEGVLAIVCDSTNVFVDGHSGSESDVRESLIRLVGQCDNRVVVTTFASNVARLESIVEAAKQHGRQVALAGRSLWRITSAAQECGYLKGIDFLTDKEAVKLPRDKVLVLCTGCQGEPRAAVSKMASGSHPNLRLAPGDTVIFSSRVIPGNEKRLYYLFNSLVKQGFEVLTEKDHFVHVSGHPARDELISMYQMIRPKVSVPVHGEARHLHEHARLARELQVPETVEAENGVVIRLEEGKSEVIGLVDSGYLAVDGISIIDTKGPVMRMRRRIIESGCVFVSLAVDRKYRLLAQPLVTAPGLLDREDDKELLEELGDEVADACEGSRHGSEDRLREVSVAAVRRILKQEIGKKPIVDVQISTLKD